MREMDDPRRLIGCDVVVDRLDRRLADVVSDDGEVDVLWFFFWFYFQVNEIIF